MSFREQNMMVMQIQLAKRQGRRPYHAGLYFARGEAARRRRRQRKPPLRFAGE
jgi:hypothetical protein